MTAFKFRLKTLLKLREQVRDARRGELAEAFGASDILAMRMQEVDGEISDAMNNYTNVSAPGTVDVDRLVELQRYQFVLQAERGALDEQQQKLDDEIDRRQQAVADADRGVRVLDKLRHRQLERHRMEQLREETKQLDEIAGRPKPREEDTCDV